MLVQYSHQTRSQHVGFYEPVIKALLYGCYGQWWHRKRSLFWWSLLFFPSFWNPCFISPQTRSLALSLSEHCAVYLFYTNLPFYIMLYLFPLISPHFLCLLSHVLQFSSGRITSLSLGGLFKELAIVISICWSGKLNSISGCSVWFPVL